MRIVFLCGCLEPGRDGVGDYTRRLAAECVRQGHACCLVALRDAAVPGARAVSGEQRCEEVSLPVLRCGAALPVAERNASARAFVDAFAPDWMSLQFVPYAFHPKGIPWRFARDLREVAAGRPLHLMFHELWIGEGAGALWRHRLVGAVQRRCILRMVGALRPRAVHTSNATYAARLRAGGVGAEELPLFGNIPIAPPDAPLPPEFLAAGIPVSGTGRGNWWLAVFFGILHPEWRPEPFASLLLRAARDAGKRVCWVSAGRMGAAGEALWERLCREYGGEIRLVRCGEQPAERISALLRCADFGVAASPWALLGKSSAAASMRDHGLPIIVPRDEGAPPGGAGAFYRCDAVLPERLAGGLPKSVPASRLGEICAGFLRALRIASPQPGEPPSPGGAL
ncbi:MAG: glycosyltransferase [Chthoniobacteraceae bacterium]|nr:glycosyltransferase [Chthoniobacteraceae bacterium]